MARGTVKWFDDRKGYGFIAQPNGKDIFVHFSAIQEAGFKVLREGEEVEFEVVRGPKGLQAVSVVKEAQLVKATDVPERNALLQHLDAAGSIRSMQHQRTPHHEFWLPILSALIHQGGTADVQDVYRFVEGRMTFNTYDLSYIEGSVPEPYWKNQVRVAALRMREEGLIEPSRQRNIWEISQKGREFLEDKRGYVPIEPPNDALQSQEALAEPSDFDQVTSDHLTIDMSTLTVREGRLKLVEHFRRERNREIIKAKKQQVLQATGCLICEVCSFDFVRVYGHLGRGFCEVHHKVPLAAVGTEVTTKLEDLAILCANCHRMVHRTNPFKSIEELKQVVTSGT